MKEDQIFDLMMDAYQFPLTLRIAAKLYIEGITEEDLAEMHFLARVPEPISQSVRNHLRDITINWKGIDHKRLSQLASML